MRLTVVGDVLLDRDEIGVVERLAPDAPVPVLDSLERRDRPGGAGLAALLLAAHPANNITLVTALGRDEPGELIRAMLDAAGVTIIDLGSDGHTAEKIRVRCGPQSLLRLDRGSAPGRVGIPGPEVAAALAAANGVLVADYGRGMTAQPALRGLLADVPATKPLVWDPHPRGARPVADAWLVTPNASEARSFAALFEPRPARQPDRQRDRERVRPSERDGSRPERYSGDQRADEHPRSALGVAAADAVLLRKIWSARAVAVTRGAEGAVLAGPSGSPALVPCAAVLGADTCGAGDRFATAVLEALCRKSTTGEAVELGVEAARAYVAGGGVSSLPCLPPAASSSDTPAGRTTTAVGSATALVDAAERVAEVHRRGGVVVAAGGCFDLLHPGHVRLLTEAARLGDLLVVLINGDDSVRRLKGPGRPIQTAADRAAVLAALDAVDLVVVFEDDTPVPALADLRPDLFVKGGDYAATDLPEARLMQRWGGQVVVLPYVTGYSTSRLVQEVNARAG